MKKKNNPVLLEYDDKVAAADSVISAVSESIYADAAEEVPAVETVRDEAIETDNAAILFEQRQRQYLKGRSSTKTITDSLGNVIIAEGMIIDDSVIDEAKAKGKLIELVMNNRA